MTTAAKDITSIMSDPAKSWVPCSPTKWTPGQPEIPSKWDAQDYGFDLKEKPPKPKTWDKMSLDKQIAYVQRVVRGQPARIATAKTKDLIGHLKAGGSLSGRGAGADLLRYAKESTQGSQPQFEQTLTHLSKLYPVKLVKKPRGTCVEVVMNPVRIPIDDYALTFGPFLVEIPLNDTSPSAISFRPCQNTPVYKTVEETSSCSRFIHPHITSIDGRSGAPSGRLCFGDEQGLAEMAIRNKDIFSLVNSIEQVLKTYNPGSPYFRPINLIQIRPSADGKGITCPLCESPFTQIPSGSVGIPVCECLAKKRVGSPPENIYRQWVIDCPPTPAEGFDDHGGRLRNLQPQAPEIRYKVMGREVKARGDSLAAHYLENECPRGAEIITAMAVDQMARGALKSNAEDAIQEIANLQEWLNRPKNERATSVYEYVDDGHYGQYKQRTIDYKGESAVRPHPEEEEGERWDEFEEAITLIAQALIRDFRKMLEKEGLVPEVIQIKNIQTPVTGVVIDEEDLISTTYAGQGITPCIKLQPPKKERTTPELDDEDTPEAAPAAAEEPPENLTPGLSPPPSFITTQRQTPFRVDVADIYNTTA